MGAGVEIASWQMPDDMSAVAAKSANVEVYDSASNLGVAANGRPSGVAWVTYPAAGSVWNWQLAGKLELVRGAWQFKLLASTCAIGRLASQPALERSFYIKAHYPYDPGQVLKDLATMNEELDTVIKELDNDEIKGRALKTSISRILKVKKQALGHFPAMANGLAFRSFYDLSERLLNALDAASESSRPDAFHDLEKAFNLGGPLIVETAATDEGELPASLTEGLRGVDSEIDHINKLAKTPDLSNRAFKRRIDKVEAKFRTVLESAPNVFGHPFRSVFDPLAETDGYLQKALTHSDEPSISEANLKLAQRAKDRLESLLRRHA